MEAQQSDRRQEVVASSLDESTHAELRLLYQESSGAILFAKALQWRTVGASLLIYVVLMALPQVVTDDIRMIVALMIVLLLVIPAAIYMLVVYQVWQHAEMEKIEVIGLFFSNAFRDLKEIKSAHEANVHRYTLLSFMILSVVAGGVVTFLSFLTLFAE